MLRDAVFVNRLGWVQSDMSCDWSHGIYIPVVDSGLIVRHFTPSTWEVLSMSCWCFYKWEPRGKIRFLRPGLCTAAHPCYIFHTLYAKEHITWTEENNTAQSLSALAQFEQTIVVQLTSWCLMSVDCFVISCIGNNQPFFCFLSSIFLTPVLGDNLESAGFRWSALLIIKHRSWYWRIVLWFASESCIMIRYKIEYPWSMISTNGENLCEVCVLSVIQAHLIV